ncbi:nucleotidyltransferase family protein [Oceanibium sediminis]|uniref:nucleotidyltransferase family protein n=1 Tax=Oceanibium sediminis TaxID=2026339 RepID=UPI000DD3D21E|nr:nucleotidyltransferase family protein [Oceanibium sediminis]
MWPVMIFAAGRGTRMRHLTSDRPKPMVPVAGRPLVDHALDLLVGAGATHVVVNVHHKPAPLLAHLEAERRLDIAISHERGQLLDTGGGLRHALGLLGGSPAVTLNADAVWSGPNPLAFLRDVGAPAPVGARLLLVPSAQAVGHLGAGDFFLGGDGRLTRRGQAARAPYVYTGLQVIDTALLAEVADDAFSLNVVWDRMLSLGTLEGCVYPGRWCDVGQPESLPLAEAMLADD